MNSDVEDIINAGTEDQPRNIPKSFAFSADQAAIITKAMEQLRTRKQRSALNKRIATMATDLCRKVVDASKKTEPV